MKNFVLLAIIIVVGCSPEKKKSKIKEAAADGSNIVVSKYDNGKTRAEISYKNGKQNGMSKSYDKEGNIILELPYVDGKRDGLAKKYYAGRKLYQTTEYKNDKQHGLQSKYRENGDLMSEARYENGFACAGLKEYLLDKTLKKKYPKINITPIDLLETQGVYTLKISMSEKVRSVKYYRGKLTPGGCLADELYYILQDESKKTGELKYHLPPGGFMMEEINIVAAVETLLGNTYITQRIFNLAIDN